MSVKLPQSSAPTLSTLSQTEAVDTDLSAAQVEATSEVQEVVQGDQFRAGQSEDVSQREASVNFARGSQGQVGAGMNALNLQIAVGTQQPLAVQTPAAEVSAAQASAVEVGASAQAAASQVKAAAPAQEVTDPAALEREQNAETVTRFYTAMQEGDLDTIMSLYHPDAEFSDPAYPGIKGDKLKGMWTLITNAKPKIQFSDVKANEDGTVTGHWDADYELIAGNPIHNQIDSTFEFKDGKIIKHTDSFDFGKWADQAFPGILGKMVGTRVGQFVMQKIVLPFTI